MSYVFALIKISSYFYLNGFDTCVSNARSSLTLVRTCFAIVLKRAFFELNKGGGAVFADSFLMGQYRPR
jgi:hypothetical protein